MGDTERQKIPFVSRRAGWADELEFGLASGAFTRTQKRRRLHNAVHKLASFWTSLSERLGLAADWQAMGKKRERGARRVALLRTRHLLQPVCRDWGRLGARECCLHKWGYFHLKDRD